MDRRCKLPREATHVANHGIFGPASKDRCYAEEACQGKDIDCRLGFVLGIARWNFIVDADNPNEIFGVVVNRRGRSRLFSIHPRPLYLLSELRRQAAADAAQHELFSGLTSAMLGSVELQWGLPILILGGMLVLLTAAVGTGKLKFAIRAANSTS